MLTMRGELGAGFPWSHATLPKRTSACTAITSEAIGSSCSSPDSQFKSATTQAIQVLQLAQMDGMQNEPNLPVNCLPCPANMGLVVNTSIARLRFSLLHVVDGNGSFSDV